MKSEEMKNVPELRFPEFLDEVEWEEKPLNQVCEVNPSSKNLPKKFVYIDLESVESGTLLQRKIIDLDNAPSRAQRLLQKEDIIFQMVRPYQKNNYFFDIEDDYTYVASTGYAQLRAYQSKKYLYHFLHSDGFVSNVLAKCTGSNYPAINSNDLSEITISIPKPDEQQKIADCLSSADNLITAQTKKVETLKEHKKALMQQLFPQDGEEVPKLRFPEFKNAPKWEKVKLDKLGKLVSGLTYSPDDVRDNGLLVLRSSKVQN
jgi:type I restriction enzyme S subunit